MRDSFQHVGFKFLLSAFTLIAVLAAAGRAVGAPLPSEGDTAPAELKTTVLTGTWKYSKIETTGPNAHTNDAPQPGLVIFTGRYYSAVHITSGEARPALPDPEKATAAELLKAYGPLLANSGSYVISGTTLTCRALVGKNPNLKVGEAFDSYAFKIQGGVLTLTEIATAKGPVAHPATITLTRIE